MGISLFGLTPAATYPALIKFGDNSAISGTLRALSDGLGTDLPIQVSTTGVNFTGTASIGGAALSPSSGVAGAIQFSDGSAFASDAANFFWNNTTKRLGVGTNAPAYPVTIKFSGQTGWDMGFQGIGSNTHTIGGGNTLELGYSNLNFSGTSNFGYGSSSKTFTIGTSNAISARLGVQGSGSTSATTALLVQNSAGTQSLKVTDDGSVFNYGKGAISSNTAFGQGAIANNTSGTEITAFGTTAAGSNTTGIRNTAFGNAALFLTTTGSSNNAFGYRSLVLNTAGGNNTAMGDLSLERNLTSNNTAFGAASLQNTSSGSGNVGIGANALNAHTTGSNNSALGFNTASGNFSGSVILGHAATATANNQFVVGSTGTNAGSVVTESNSSTKVWNVIINGVAQKILLA